MERLMKFPVALVLFALVAIRNSDEKKKKKNLLKMLMLIEASSYSRLLEAVKYS